MGADSQLLFTVQDIEYLVLITAKPVLRPREDFAQYSRRLQYS